MQTQSRRLEDDMALDPTVQLDPNRCICVIGPQISAEYLSSAERARTPAVLSYRRLVESGIQRVLEMEPFESSEERLHRQTLLVNAYELEPAFASVKVVESLKARGCYEQWLAEVFSSLRSAPAQRGTNAIIDHLLRLLDKGMLLAYSHCDTVLDSALGCEPILLDNEEAVRKWAARRTSGLLHIHGVHTHPASMKWDCIAYESAVGESNGSRVLKDLCRNRTVLFVGFDGEYFDPFLPKFASCFVNPANVPARCPLLIATGSRTPIHPSFLTLRLPQLVSLEKLLQPSLTPRHGTPGSEDDTKPLAIALLYTDKNSCLEAADKLKNMNAINASHLQLKLEQFDQLSMCIDREGLCNLWRILFSEPTPIHVGLLGISMSGCVTVWLKGNPCIAAECNHGRPEVASTPTPTSTLQPTTPLSLSTNVSVISSVWAPITSPTASKVPSTRPTLPSPLICSTPKLSTQKGIATFSSGGLHPNRDLFTRTPHQQVRRVQSEQDKLSYHDRLEESRKAAAAAAAARKNGVLIHQESAPTFVYTSEGVIAYPSDPNNTNIIPKPISVPNPSTLTTDGKVNEHKIEYIDQYQPGRVTNVPGSRMVAQKKQKEEEKMKDGTVNLSKSIARPQQDSNPDFVEAKLKFISEAKEWSKGVGVEISKKVAAMKPNFPVTVLPSGYRMNPLISLRTHGSSPQLLPSSSGVTPEEQEKTLKQLFENIPPQTGGGVSMLKLPQNSLSVSTAQTPSSGMTRSPRHSPHLSPRRSPKLSPKPSPFQLPISSVSPKGSPVHPFVINSTAGMFTYLPSNPALPSPASLLCSPSVSMSPYAAMFGTYQAALQQLMSPSPQGGKPVVVTDPSSVFQSLQGLQGGVMPDKVPCIMPDGTITFVSMNQNSGNSEMRTREEHIKSPLRGQKRVRSPEVDIDSRLSAPKRRRSSSLPDITQIGSTAQTAQRPNREPQNLEVEQAPRMRQTPPPNMIQIPKEMKFGDPMLGFPTPPQGSSPSSHFTASPLILSNMAMFQSAHPMTPLTPDQEVLNSEDMKEIVEASPMAALPPSPEGTSLPPFPAGRGPIQLWQFLLDLLLSPDKSHMIQWTGNGYEFRITKPEDVAVLWGARKNKPKMNYDKLSRGLRYYYSKGIMDKVPGKKLTFKYTCDVQHYVKSRNTQAVQPPFGDVNTDTKPVQLPFGDVNTNTKPVQLPFGTQHINSASSSVIEVKSEL